MYENNALLFMGYPFCGKGRTGKTIASITEATRLEMGEFLREYRKKVELRNTHQPWLQIPELAGLPEDGPNILQEVRTGGYVPDHQISHIFRQWFAGKLNPEKKEDVASKMVFDGTPRTRSQMEDLLRLLKNARFNVFTIWISTPPEICLERAIKNKRPGREDDDITVAWERMFLFEEQTLPLYADLKTRTRFLDINPEENQPAEEVCLHVLQVLGLNHLVIKPALAA